MIATIINFLRNLFNRNKGTITGSISGAIANAQSVAKQTPSKVDLGPQIVKQHAVDFFSGRHELNALAVGDRIELVHPAGNAELALERLEKADGTPIDVAPGNGHRVWAPLPASAVGAFVARFV
jgi:hypothetical protein